MTAPFPAKLQAYANDQGMGQDVHLVVVDGVTKRYPSGDKFLEVLKGVDLEVRKGEILAVQGPSGVGKSTLLHLMGTLDRPTSGSIWFRGRNVCELDNGELHRLRNDSIGFVFQFYHLLPEFNALENVMLPALVRGVKRAECAKRALELLGAVGLEERIHHRPSAMSGGEQQRVAIARALFNSPEIIYADEPTGNLDKQTSAEVIEVLWRFCREEGATLVIVTHDEELAAKADRVAMMREGRIVSVSHARVAHCEL